MGWVDDRVLGNVVNGMLNPVAIPYGLVSMSIGLLPAFSHALNF